jgi:hypothetical protein
MAGIVQQFRLLFDKTTAAATERATQESLDRSTNPEHAKKNLGEVKGVMADLRAEAIHLGEALLAAFAFHKIIGFFESAIKAAGENEHSMHQLETAVRNAGSSFEEMGPQIQASLDVLYEHSRFTRVELRAAFGNLVQLTGSVDKAMGAMATTVEFATGRNLDLGTAATLVGRYLTGQENALTRYIGRTAEGVNVLERLRNTFRNAAENEMKSYEGRLLSITKAKNDLLVAIGELIIGDTALGGTVTNVADVIRGATRWVKAHHDEISHAIGKVAEFGAGLLNLAGRVLPYLGKAYQEAQVAIVAITAAWDASGEAFKLWGDTILERFGSLVNTLSIAADFLGIHAFDKIGQWGFNIAKSAKVGADAAKAQLQVIRDAAIRTAHDILNPPPTQIIAHRAAGPGVGAPLPTAAESEQAFRRAMEEHKAAAEMAAENLKMGIDIAANLKVLADEEEYFANIASDATKKAKDRNEALKEELKIRQEILDEQLREEAIREAIAGENNPAGRSQTEVMAGVRAHLGPMPNEGESEQKLADIKEYGKVMGTILDGIDNDATKVAENIYDAFYNSLNHITLSFKGLAQAVAGIFKGTAKAILRELQEEAKGEAIHDAAAAIQQFAWGLARSAVGDAAGASLHFASAKTFALSALEWGGAALAEGALLGGQGAGGGGHGAGISGGAGARDTTGVNAVRGTLNIYLDGVDPLNPRHQELIGEAKKRYDEVGGPNVIYHPGRRSA